MNREDIIRMAQEAGFSEWAVGLSEMPEHLEHFAKLVAEHEREAVLDLVDGYAKNNTTLAEQTGEESSILFSLNDGKEVMRIDKNGVTANPEIRVDEAGAHVISALDVYIKNLIKAERNACAKIAETPVFGEQDDITMEAKDRIANDIRAR